MSQFTIAQNSISILRKLSQFLALVGSSFLLTSINTAAEPRQFLPLEHFRDCDACSEMIALPSGTYMMGASDNEFRDKIQYRSAYLNETPQHKVKVKSFALAKFSVTRAQFEIFASETGFLGNGCRVFNGTEWKFDPEANWKNPGFKQSNRDPVVCISWDDTQKFISWLNSKLSKSSTQKYRLPTEEEWEYAARAGTITAAYWGDNTQEQCLYENARDLSAKSLDPTAPYASCRDNFEYTAPVGSFRSNPWGFFDMLGNTLQWVENCPSAGYHHSPIMPDINSAYYSAFCGVRALRGGSWASIPNGVRSASRGGMKPSMRESVFGFRLATDITN